MDMMKDDLKHNNACRLSLAKEEFFKHNVAFILSKNSPLQSIFNKKIMEILQSGLMDYWHRRSLPTMSAKEKCNFLNEHHKERPLTLDDLRGAFLILSIGLILAIGAFLLEIIHSKIK